MRRTKNPCRQLNSEAIKGAALCYLSPIISGKCSIISAKCCPEVRDQGLESAWLNVCLTRDTCDKALLGIKNVAFFFSSITTQSRKSVGQKIRAKDKDEAEDDDESEDDEEITASHLIAGGTSQGWIAANQTLVDKKLSPAVGYWIALTTPNGAPANPLIVHRVLLECGVETVANQVKFQESRESAALKELYKVLKDHRNPFMRDLVNSSYQSLLKAEASHYMSDSMDIVDDCIVTESVVRVTLVNKAFQSCLQEAILKLECAKLNIDRFGFEESNSSKTQESAEDQDQSQRFCDQLTVLINDIGIAMKTLGYAVYRGKIYKHMEKSKYTYSYKCDPRPFVNILAANEDFKARLLKDMKKVIDILSDPFCEVIRPINVNYDLIEVNDGYCWSIKGRRFVYHAIDEKDIGQITPRAFCPFDHAKEPNPKYFREILENSLSEVDIEIFCEDFLKLLNYNKKKHKEKVPCLVGDTNSGKTSLFIPLLGVIHHQNIATITKQRVFNKAMITDYTEVVFIDEATPSTLDIDDWKILTQGGYAAHDVKYRTAKSFINRCPMIITAQNKLEFEPEHRPAMERRLRTYTFKSLPRLKKRAAEWLQRHPMECIVWAASKARQAEDEVDSGTDESEHQEESDTQDGFLKESEKEALKSLVFKDVLTNDTPPMIGRQQGDDEINESGEEEEDEDEDDDDDQTQDLLLSGEFQEDSEKDKSMVRALKKTLRQCSSNSLRYRQLQQLLQGHFERMREEKEHNEREYRRRQEILESKGVSRESVDLLPADDMEPMPPQIQQELEAIHQKLLEKREREEENKIKTAFENPWVERTERKLYACVLKLQSDPTNTTQRKSTNCLQEILSDKLKTHFTNLKLFKCEKAVLERRKKCVEWGLLEDNLKHLVTSLHEALPFTPQERVDETEKGSADVPSQSLLTAQSQEHEGFIIDRMKRRQEDAQEARPSGNSPKRPRITSLLSYFMKPK